MKYSASQKFKAWIKPRFCNRIWNSIKNFFIFPSKKVFKYNKVFSNFFNRKYFELFHLGSQTYCKIWVEAIRIPNLFTVPGDVIAGAMLACAGINPLLKHPQIIFISMLIYTSGILLNDYFDIAIDRKERPSRPIPSGRISKKSVLTVSIIGILSAVILAVLSYNKTLTAVVIMLSAAVFSYNAFARKIPVTGFIIMGLCRGLNLLIGASLGNFNFSVLTAAGIETIYITFVTVIAYNEVKLKKINLVSSLIYGLIFLQAGFVIFSGASIYQKFFTAAFLILLFFFARVTGKKFYSS